MRNCVQKASKLRLNTNSNRLLHPFIFVIFILPKLKMVQFAKEVHAVVISEKRSSPLSHIGLDAPLCLMRPAPLPLFHRSIKCYNFILSARQPLKVESSSIFFFATFSFLSFSLNFFLLSLCINTLYVRCSLHVNIRVQQELPNAFIEFARWTDTAEWHRE